jgi:propanediol dehydratase large subunit
MLGRKTLDVLQALAAGGSGNIGQCRLQQVLAPVSGDGIRGSGSVRNDQNVEL